MEIKVISSMPLDTATAGKIEKAFSKKHSEKVSFVYEVDSKIIGGVLVIDGDRYYDATIKGQLSRLKKTL